MGLYHDALVAVVADGVVTDEEMNVLAKLRQRFALRPEQYRSLHARLFASFISIYADDEWLADSEADSLHKLYRCLEEAGWAPGNKV